MTPPTLPNNIQPEEFQDALNRYDQAIEAISAAKSGEIKHTSSTPCKDLHGTNAPAAKSGQKTLAELDRYRYTDAPTLFALKKSSRPMQLQDVKDLVEWKLSVFNAPRRLLWRFSVQHIFTGSFLPLPYLAV